MNVTPAHCLAMVVVIIGALFIFRRTRKFMVETLTATDMPVWLSLCLVLAAAVGTYYIAPLVNENFEFQKNRSAHVLQTVEKISNSNVELAVLTRKFNDSLFYDKDSLEGDRNALLDKITEYSWLLIDVDVVLSRANAERSCVEGLNGHLDALRKSVIASELPQDQESVLKAASEVTESARNCSVVLYEAAKL